MPSALVLIHLLCFSIVGTDARPASFADAAPNLWVQEELRSTVDRLWRDSPTFQAQVVKIGRSHMLHVALTIDMSLRFDRGCRAQCTMRTFASGLTLARVNLPMAVSGALDELIPHELEHICERIDGIDVTAAAYAGRAGFWVVGDGRIETGRAIRAGERARAELHQATTVLTRR
jgi:hypothetical protein